MLDALKRLFGGPAAARVAGPWEAVATWAEQRGCAFRGVHDGEGFVVEGRAGATPWRLEWGPSQRSYIEGPELRLRAEPGLPGALQAVVMNRELREALEKAVFEQYVETVQTRIDDQTPPEMRWLVMFPELPAADLPRELRGQCVAVGSHKSWLAQWLHGPLAQVLASARIDPQQPLVLMVGRGRLSLRTALPEPDVAPIQAALRVFETALREAQRAAESAAGAGDDGAEAGEALD